jgi:cell division protein FtsL
MKKINKKPKLVYLIFGLVLVLAGAQLILSHWLATTGGKLRQWEEKTQSLEQQNRVLTEEINHMGSLSRIASEAQRLGLVKADKVLYLTPQIPVALENTNNLER